MEFDPGIDIQVLDGVYEPAEDSHLLLEAIEVEKGMRVLEIGTGSGFIALHCAKAGARVTATDINPRAVKCSHGNAERNGIVLDIILTDLVKGIEGEFDAIVFNPPYLIDEDTDVLEPDMQRNVSGGIMGSEISIRFLDQARDLLKPDGTIYLLTSSGSEDLVLEHAMSFLKCTRISEIKLFFEVLGVYKMESIKQR